MKITTRITVTALYDKTEVQDVKVLSEMAEATKFKVLEYNDKPTETEKGYYVYERDFDVFQAEMLHDARKKYKSGFKNNYVVMLEPSNTAQLIQVSKMYATELEANVFIDSFKINKHASIHVFKKISTQRHNTPKKNGAKLAP